MSIFVNKYLIFRKSGAERSFSEIQGCKNFIKNDKRFKNSKISKRYGEIALMEIIGN